MHQCVEFWAASAQDRAVPSSRRIDKALMTATSSQRRAGVSAIRDSRSAKDDYTKPASVYCSCLLLHQRARRKVDEWQIHFVRVQESVWFVFCILLWDDRSVFRDRVAWYRGVALIVYDAAENEWNNLFREGLRRLLRCVFRRNAPSNPQK